MGITGKTVFFESILRYYLHLYHLVDNGLKIRKIVLVEGLIFCS
jgi:hypothetical protein